MQPTICQTVQPVVHCARVMANDIFMPQLKKQLHFHPLFRNDRLLAG